MNKQGYAIKELLILFAVLGIVFTFAITKVSFAYQEVDNEEELLAMKDRSIQIAAEAYVNAHKENFTAEETFFFGKELVENHYLVDVEDQGYNTVKIRVTHPANTEEYHVEIVE